MKMLLKQDYVASRLNSSLRNLYVCPRDLVDRNEHIFLNWQLIFALFLRFFPSITDRAFTGLIYEQDGGCLIKSRAPRMTVGFFSAELSNLLVVCVVFFVVSVIVLCLDLIVDSMSKMSIFVLTFIYLFFLKTLFEYFNYTIAYQSHTTWYYDVLQLKTTPVVQWLACNSTCVRFPVESNQRI